MDTPSQTPLEATTPLGFSAAGILATMGGTQTISLKWLADSAMYATHERAGTQTTLTLALSNASATFVESTGGGCPSRGDGPCITCRSRLEIAADATLATTDGALNESTRITLVASEATTATLRADIEAATVKGDYFEKVKPKAGYEHAGIHVESAYGGSFPGSRKVVPSSWNGFIAATVKATGAPSGMGVHTSHGFFPPETGP